MRHVIWSNTDWFGDFVSMSPSVIKFSETRTIPIVWRDQENYGRIAQLRNLRLEDDGVVGDDNFIEALPHRYGYRRTRIFLSHLKAGRIRLTGYYSNVFYHDDPDDQRYGSVKSARLRMVWPTFWPLTQSMPESHIWELDLEKEVR